MSLNLRSACMYGYMHACMHGWYMYIHVKKYASKYVCSCWPWFTVTKALSDGLIKYDLIRLNHAWGLMVSSNNYSTSCLKKRQNPPLLETGYCTVLSTFKSIRMYIILLPKTFRIVWNVVWLCSIKFGYWCPLIKKRCFLGYHVCWISWTTGNNSNSQTSDIFSHYPR